MWAATRQTLTRSNGRSRRYWYSNLTPSMIQELSGALSPQAEVSTNKYELDRHGTGESYHPTAPPELVVCPSTVKDVQTVARYCHKHAIPLTAFGAGTSVEGHVSCLHGGISLDTKLLNDIVHDDNTATVGAGVTRTQLNAALKQTGWHFTVDPGADATLGGMVATGASGTTTMRYGTMRDNLLQLDLVLADGSRIQTGTCTAKSSAGYDLVSLFCGSEGTLGIVVSCTVVLRPQLPYKATAVARFSTIGQAAQVCTLIQQFGVPLVRCELLDATSMKAFNDYSQQKQPVHPTLFLEFQSFSPDVLQQEIHQIRELCEDAQEFDSRTDESSSTLWEARHKLYYAAIANRPGATSAIVTDACVPLSRFGAVLEETIADVEASNVVGPCFGHAGDGNLHCILPVCDNDVDTGYFATLQAVQERLMDRTLAAKGTITGEHGIGYGKIPYLSKQYSEPVVATMKAIKQALDPKNILNPGKVVPP